MQNPEGNAEADALANPYFFDTSTMTHVGTVEPEMRPWEEMVDSDGWTQDLMNASPAFTRYSSPRTPSTPSYSSGPSTIWSFGGNAFEPNEPRDHLSATNAPALERSRPCSCLTVILQMLQYLHQNFRQPPAPQAPALAALSYAAVLNMNEEATTYCTGMLRCAACQSEDRGDSFTIAASLLRRVLSLTEAWVATPPARPQMMIAHNDGGFIGGGPGQQSDDWRLKAQILLIGIKKMEGVVAELKQASQGVNVDYERLTCVSLAVNLSARLKSASDSVGCI